MATIQDIFDWLNQGAQGDIPGTGGEQPSPTPSSNPYSQSSVPGTQDNPPSMSAPGSADRNSFWNQNQIAPYNPPGVADDRVSPSAFQGQPSPQDYADGIPPDLMPHYQALVQSGVPPQMAHMILTQGQGQQQQGQDKEKKPQGLQGSPGYQAGHEAGMGLDQLFFGKPQQQSQQSGQQAQTQPGLFDWLGSWFNSPQSDWSQ